MVIRANKFTPEVLLSAPRRGTAVPNHDGTLALFTVSAYSFESKTTTYEIRVLDLKSGVSVLFSNDENAHDANWLGDGTNTIIWLQSGAKGTTSLMIGDGDEPSKASYTADVFLAPFKDLKLTPLVDGTIACAMTGLATPEGSLYNAETAKKSPSSARIYDQRLVRFWDKYLIPQKNVIWYSKLEKSDGQYSLAAPMHNALKGTEIESPFYNPMGSGLDDFDISPTGILFNAMDPAVVQETEGKSDIYYVPLSTFIESDSPKPRIIDTGKFGRCMNPRFSPCGTRAAFIKSYESRPMDYRLMMVSDLTESLKAYDFFQECRRKTWHLAPSGVEWSQDGNCLYLTADDCARVVLFKLPLIQNSLPLPLTKNGAVSGYYPLKKGKDDKLLVSSSSFIESSVYRIVDISEKADPVIVSSMSKHGSKLGLSHAQVSEMYFEGAGEYCVQAWVVKPSNFDKEKKYPLALLIHGGPEDAWREAWSTRWNPAVWAEQGYVCILPNVTGSTGFGLDLVEGIYGQWGGRPYNDLANCFEYVQRHMPFVDTDNAIAAGASYGGYMANWIQGNSLGRKFKAIVCHDGIFSTQMLIAGDEFGGDKDFAGPILPWKNWKHLEQWNPARPDLLRNWTTPMLVVHSDKDYRCIMSDGIAAYNTLQTLGTPSRLLNFPDEGHWVLKPENSLVWHKTVFEWINKYSGISDKKKESVEPISIVV